MPISFQITFLGWLYKYWKFDVTVEKKKKKQDSLTLDTHTHVRRKSGLIWAENIGQYWFWVYSLVCHSLWNNKNILCIIINIRKIMPYQHCIYYPLSAKAIQILTVDKMYLGHRKTCVSCWNLKICLIRLSWNETTHY